MYAIKGTASPLKRTSLNNRGCDFVKNVYISLDRIWALGRKSGATAIPNIHGHSLSMKIIKLALQNKYVIDIYGGNLKVFFFLQILGVPKGQGVLRGTFIPLLLWL